MAMQGVTLLRRRCRAAQRLGAELVERDEADGGYTGLILREPWAHDWLGGGVFRSDNSFYPEEDRPGSFVGSRR